MESLLTFFVCLVFQILFAHLWYKNGVKAVEKRIKNLSSYTFYQGDELAIIVKKKESHYEIQIVDKELVKFK